MEKMLLVRYGEIGLKGKNRYQFERKLVKNMKSVLKGQPVNEIQIYHGRYFVTVQGDDSDFQEVQKRLTKVFGIVSVSPVLKVPTNMEDIRAAAIQVFKAELCRQGYDEYELGFEDQKAPLSDQVLETRDVESLKEHGISFKVEARRSDKSFALNSMELNKELGAYILKNFPGVRVDVHTPDIMLWVEIRHEGAFVYSEKIPGPGGLPVGTTGRGIALLSGGIDSPIAVWLAMKRGIEVNALHFHSYPFTSQRALSKVEDLCQVLVEYGGPLKLYVNHFTEIQKAIQENCREEMWVTVMRWFMFQIANRLAGERKALSLVTGENIGQVASQTLESMQVVSHGVDRPILRPLAGMDKKEIMKKAEQIGTYNISIRPYQDCCTLFLPQNPKTKPRLDQLEEETAPLDIEALIEESMRKTEVKYFYPYPETASGELSLDL